MMRRSSRGSSPRIPSSSSTDPLFVRVRDFLEWAGDAAYVPHPPEEADVRTLVSVRARALLRELDREAGRE